METRRQVTDTVLMVPPVEFGFNAETAVSNTFQQRDDARAPEAIQAAALAEHEGVVAALRGAGVTVELGIEPPNPHRNTGFGPPHVATPDALFPNNWFSTHEDGTLVLYPMATPNRRAERREDLIYLWREERYRTLLDLTRHEGDGRFLEGTGSLVLDHVHRTAYVCVSIRADAGLVETWSRHMGYASVTFHATAPDARGVETPVYHTNVVMAVGERSAVVCADAVGDPGERRRLCASLAETGHRVIEITKAQMNGFAGNLLELATTSGGRVWAMSSAAHDALTADQRAALAEDGPLVHAPIPTIERVGGGSVRCLIGEIFRP
jgi:hypothetical protein